MGFRTVVELKEKIIAIGNELLRQAPTRTGFRTQEYFRAQALACFEIAHNEKLLLQMFQLVNDGEHTLADVLP